MGGEVGIEIELTDNLLLAQRIMETSSSYLVDYPRVVFPLVVGGKHELIVNGPELPASTGGTREKNIIEVCTLCICTLSEIGSKPKVDTFLRVYYLVLPLDKQQNTTYYCRILKPKFGVRTHIGE